MKKIWKNNALRFVWLYTAFFIYSGVTVCSKIAASELNMNKRFWLFLLLEIFFLSIYAILWQQALKYFDLAVAMASKGIVVIVNLIWAVLLFHEKITISNILGAAFIIAGIGLVSKNG